LVIAVAEGERNALGPEGAGKKKGKDFVENNMNKKRMGSNDERWRLGKERKNNGDERASSLSSVVPPSEVKPFDFDKEGIAESARPRRRGKKGEEQYRNAKRGKKETARLQLRMLKLRRSGRGRMPRYGGACAVTGKGALVREYAEPRKKRFNRSDAGRG